MSMNMWCTRLMCFLLNLYTNWLRNKPNNIVEIIPSEKAKHTNGQSIVSSRPLNNKCIVYQPDALKAMCDRLQHYQWLRFLPFGTLDKIRSYKLNNKPSKSNLHLRYQLHQYKANTSNLIRIKNSGYKMDSQIIFATCNIQSLCYKELQVSQLISDYSLDFIVLTETWLNANHNQWKDTTVLNNNQLRLHRADCGKGKGGGLALIYKSHYPIRNISSGSRSSFEYACWELKAKNNTLTVHSIYHPPYSLTNKITNGKFTEEFTEYVSTCLPEHPNNIFIGDFNLHVSN